MEKRRITSTDLDVGKPLPFDVFDDRGKLLLRKGFVISTESQLERLMDQGLYTENDGGGGGNRKATLVNTEKEPESALKMLYDARAIVDSVSVQHKNPGYDFHTKLAELSKLVVRACEVNKDVALAMILLKQDGSYACRHLVDVAALCCIIGRAMHLPKEEFDTLVAAALTMNIGMIEVQDKLNGFSGQLAPTMLTAIQSHPQKSVDILKKFGLSDELLLTLVMQHHEADDGSGYPKGLKAEEIHRCAKIISLADRYCAQVSHRDKRPMVLPHLALRELFLTGGKKCDPVIAAYFVRELGIYPPGTVVRLSNGEVGVVSKPGEIATSPWVHALLSPRGAPLAFSVRRKTTESIHAIHDVVDPRKLDYTIRMVSIWGKEAAGG